jgi:hypothetical protein
MALRSKGCRGRTSSVLIMINGGRPDRLEIDLPQSARTRLRVRDERGRHNRMSRKLGLRHVDERSCSAALSRGHFFRQGASGN